MNLLELKKKSPAELILQAEKLEIENPSTLRKQEIYSQFLKNLHKTMNKSPEVVFWTFYKMVSVF